MKRFLLITGILFLALLCDNAWAQTDQALNNGSFTSNVNFPNNGCIYHWVNNNPNIGLSKNGTGDIATFLAINNSNNVVSATITATSSAGCAPIIFTITVNPTIPALKTTGNIIPLSTVYGTASSAMQFFVSGTNLRAGVVVDAPTGFEVSTDNTTFSPSVILNSDNAQLSYINLSPDVIRTAISGPGNYNYSATVENSVQSILVAPIASSTSATITINNTSISNGEPLPVALSPGNNMITIAVTAQNGTTVKTYIINIIRAGSSDATLSGLGTDQSSISPIFAPGTLNYTTTVYSNAISITPSVTNSGASVKVNGSLVASGSSSASIALNNANNIIPIVVTAQDGVTTKTYSLTVISTRSSNAGLSKLALTPAVTMVRVPGTTNYTTTVSSSVTSVQQTTATSDANATIKVNGVAVTSGAMTDPIPLNATGNTVITTVVTAQDGVNKQSYTITISKSSPANASLSSMSLTPFANIVSVGNNNFTASVSPGITSVKVNNTASDNAAIIRINGVIVASGTDSGPIPLNATGPTLITTVMTAPNGTTTKTYTLTISKGGSSNANMYSLALNLSAAVTQILGTNNYFTSVSPTVNSVQQSVIPRDATASVKVNGIAVTNGTPSSPITLNATGSTVINTVVTAEDTKTVQTYTLTVNKNGSTNTGINKFYFLPAATLTVTPGTNTYNTSVDPDVTSIQQVMGTSDPNATIKVNGVPVASGAPSNPIPLNASGPTTITTLITAQDGVTTRTITTIVRKNGSTNTDINLITVTPSATLTLVPGTNNFTTSVTAATSSINLMVSPSDDNATITINGLAATPDMASDPIALNATGTTSVTITVTAPDKTTVRTYTIIVSKNGSTNADITQLYLTPSATLTAIPGTNNFVTSINSAVTSVRLTTIPSDPHAVITVNGNVTASSAASQAIALNSTGITTITVDVKAQDGISVKTYNIMVTRGSNGEMLNPIISNLPATPVYIRLADITPAGEYAGNVVLTSDLSTSANMPMANCKVFAAPLTIITGNVVKKYGAALMGVSGSTAYTIAGGVLKHGNTINAVTISYGAGGQAGANAGEYFSEVIPSDAVGSNGFMPGNYNITYKAGNIKVVPVSLTAIADNITKDFGVNNPPLTITYKGFVNGDGPEKLLKTPTITTTATDRSTIGKYPISISSGASPNYLFTYVPGTLTVSDNHLAFFIPNTITPNGDGINDTWNIQNVDAYAKTTIDVFNRQGQKVFTSVGYATAWDGTYHGAPLPSGTYYYFIKNSIKVISGNINLVR